MDIADLLLTSTLPEFFYFIFTFTAWHSDVLKHGVLLLSSAGNESTLMGSCSERCTISALEREMLPLNSIRILKQKIPQMRRIA